MSVCAVLGGADKWVKGTDFCPAQREWREQMLDLGHGNPSHDTVHWVLDVSFREDDSRNRRGHWNQNRARPQGTKRRLALDQLCHKTSSKVGIAAISKRAGWDMDYLYKVFSPKMQLP